MHRWTSRRPSRIIVVVALMLSVATPLLPSGAYAVAFDQAFIRLDRMKAGDGTNGVATGATICVKPTASATEDHVIVVWPSNYSVDSTAANYVVDFDDLPAGANAWLGMTAGTTAASSVSGQTVTWPSGDLVAGTLYCFHFTDVNTIKTMANSAGETSQQASVETQTSANSRIEYTQVALANIPNDQITVTAVVPPSFIFTIDNVSSSMGNLSPASGNSGVKSSTTGQTVSITTNAKGGWVMWAKDQWAGLRSVAAGYTLPTGGTIDGSPDTLNGGAAERYVLDVDKNEQVGGCTIGVAGEYNGLDAFSGGTFSNTNYEQIADCTGTAPATSSNESVTLWQRATITASTPAGTDYTDVITVVGAGNF